MFKKVSLVFTILIVGYIIFLIFIPINNNDHLVGVLKFYNDTQIVNPKTVNLTDEGLLDWAHWGFGAEEWTDTSQYTHKAEVSPLINMDTIIVTNKLLNDSPAQVYWYDEPTDNIFK